MKISASILNTAQENAVQVRTNDTSQSISLSVKGEGRGSSINGGELLFLSLAVCFFNDIYREASKRKINILSAEVNVSGEFGSEGVPGSNIQYELKIDSNA
jgi:uncharacterized OsmC-like protein